MKSIWASMLLKIIAIVTSKAFIDKVVDLVAAAMKSGKSGEEKRAMVLAGIRELGGELAPIVREAGQSIINLAVEIAVAWVKAKRG